MGNARHDTRTELYGHPLGRLDQAVQEWHLRNVLGRVVIVCVVQQAFSFVGEIGIFIVPVQRQLFFHIVIGLNSEIHIVIA
jgi:hypothetical protein